MANPVFSRAEAFQPRGNPYGQPAYAGQGIGRSTAYQGSLAASRALY